MEDVRKEIYEIFHQFLIEREWVVKEKEIDRMRLTKRQHLEKTDDLLRLFIATVVLIKRKRSFRDFCILIKRIAVFLRSFYKLSLDNLLKLLDDAAEKEKGI